MRASRADPDQRARRTAVVIAVVITALLTAAVVLGLQRGSGTEPGQVAATPATADALADRRFESIGALLGAPAADGVLTLTFRPADTDGPEDAISVGSFSVPGCNCDAVADGLAVHLVDLAGTVDLRSFVDAGGDAAPPETVAQMQVRVDEARAIAQCDPSPLLLRTEQQVYGLAIDRFGDLPEAEARYAWSVTSSSLSCHPMSRCSPRPCHPQHHPHRYRPRRRRPTPSRTRPR